MYEDIIMDIFESEFVPALKADDFIKAENALEKWKLQASKATYLWSKSLLLHQQKKYDYAQNALSEAIDGKFDENRTCLFQRAENYLDLKQYNLALIDFEEVLSDKTQKVVDTYNSAAQFRKTFILAVLGDNQFKNEIENVQLEGVVFITDALYDKDSLIKIYNATKKPVREKPKLK
jgi:tetratricopeptide (TPR) repeat protein